MSKYTGDGIQRDAGARFGGFKLDRALALLILCAVSMPLLLTRVGRLPWLLLGIGLAAVGVYCLLKRLPSSFRAQGIAALCVVAFYACGALINVNPEKIGFVDFADNTCFHSGLAESLLHGELSLPVEPNYELLKSKNPYALPRDFDYVWDASYFEGKYYVYFGIAPVLTTYLPFRLIAQRPLPTIVAMVIYLSGGFIGSLFVLERARRLCGFRLPTSTVQVISTLLLGFATIAPVMLRRVSVYEVCIACAYCFSMWGFYLLLGQTSRMSRWAAPGGAVLASLFMGLAAGSRPTFFATGIPLTFVFLLQAKRHWKAEQWAVFYRAVSLLGPFVLCVGLLGLYNKVRFGSWTEFGTHYQLNLIDQFNVKFSPDKLWIGLAYYLFSWPTFTHQFPPLRVDLTSLPFQLGKHPISHEGVLGLFATVPVSIMLAAAPFIAWHRKNRYFGWAVASLVGFAVLMLLAVSVASVVPRYEMDFLPSILVASILTFYGTQSRDARIAGVIGEVLWVPAACYSIVIVLVASIADSGTGMPDALKIDYAGIYSLLRVFLWWN